MRKSIEMKLGLEERPDVFKSRWAGRKAGGSPGRLPGVWWAVTGTLTSSVSAGEKHWGF